MQSHTFWNVIGALALSAALAAVPSTTLALPTLVIDGGGKLAGATEIEIGGSLYDVEFVDGTCAAVFGACDPASFMFPNLVDALAASAALGSQVFGAGDVFDEQTEKTSGCTNTIACFIATPYGVTTPAVSLAYFSNSVAGDDTGDTGFLTSTDFAAANNYVWARWAASDPVVRDVPEPGPLGLVALGLVAAGAHRHRRAHRAAFAL